MKKLNLSDFWNEWKYPLAFGSTLAGIIMAIVIPISYMRARNEKIFNKYATEQNRRDYDKLQTLHRINGDVGGLFEYTEYERLVDEFELKYKMALDSIKQAHKSK
jgi:hypothetical protein